MTVAARTARPFPWRVLTLAVVTTNALTLALVIDMPTRLVWNVTASVPTGLYAVRADDRLRPGVLTAVLPPESLASWMVSRGYLGRGVPLLKRIEALPGARVCREGARVTVNGVLRAVARDADRFGRPLPRWSGCRMVGDDELFFLNIDAPGSLDGRYFGPLPRSAVIGRATPLWLDEERP